MIEEKSLRHRVLAHIELHSEGGRYGSRVPDAWIGEANASIEDGQTMADARGRRLTEAGRDALRLLDDGWTAAGAPTP